MSSTNYTPKKMIKKTNVAPKKKVEIQSDVVFLFGKANYKWLLISLFVVFVGFIAMSGSNDINDFRKIVLAPIIVLSGFGLGFYAIFRNPEK